jgi:hypothetical protein
MPKTVRARVEKLEKAALEAAGAAIDRLFPLIKVRDEQLALAAVLHANLGLGPPVDDVRTRRLAERAAVTIWAAATDLERQLVWGHLPLPRPRETE